MAEWVAPRPIFYICEREMGYEGGGKIQVQWWRQASADNQLQVTIEDILVVERVRRRRESGRCGKRKGG